MAQNDVKYTLKGGFFNGAWIGEGDAPAVSYDRVYDSEDMIQPYQNVVTDGIFAYETTVDSDEPILQMGFSCAVNGSSEVVLRSGSGLLNHHWFELDHVETIEIAQNSTLTTRIDSLIIQCNMGMTDRAMYLIYRQGSASQPALEGDGSTIFEFRLWNINVPSNQIGGAMTLDDKRATDDCPVITGLLQQLSLEDRLKDFDSQIDEKLKNYDSQFNDKIEGFDSQFSQKVEQYDTQYETKLSQYDSQFSQKMQTYDNSMTQIWAEWESLKAQIGSGSGGGTIINTNNLEITRGYLEYASASPVTISDYDEERDTIFLFINGLYANTVNDYSIDSSGAITFKNTINNGAGIDWWKFRITQTSGGGGTTTEPEQGFQLTVKAYDGSTVQPSEDGRYQLGNGISYFLTAPYYAGTYRWESQYEDDAWTQIEDAEGLTLVIVGGDYTAVRCIVTYQETEYISEEVGLELEISGTVEDPIIQIEEDDGYIHQNEVVAPTEKVATPVITVSSFLDTDTVGVCSFGND